MNKSQINYIAKKLRIKESIKDVIPIYNDWIVHTELKIIRLSHDLKKKIWQSDFHNDVIVKVKIINNKIEVTELNGTKYFINAETGKPL